MDQLKAKAQKLASQLGAQHLKPMSLVAFKGAATEQTVVQILSLMTLDVILVPVNPYWQQAKVQAWIRALRCDYWLEDDQLTPLPTQRALVKPDKSGFLLATSGSSGKEKAVFLPMDALWNNAKAAVIALSLQPHHCWWLNLPLSHVGGLGVLFRALVGDFSISLTASEKVSHLSWVPTQLYRALHADHRLLDQLSRLEMALIGGAACPESLVQRSLQRGMPLFTSYGMTETASMVCIARLDEQTKSGYLGELLPGMRLSLSTEGEIQVSGSSLFAGYWPLEQEQVTSVALFATGDLAVEEAGKWYYAGRKNSRFISAGENIQPEEIEQLLLAHEEVEEAIVVPLEDEEYGARPVALLTLSGNRFTEKMLGNQLNALAKEISEKLGGICVPVQWYALPRQQGIKRSRKQLAAKLASGDASLIRLD